MDSNANSISPLSISIGLSFLISIAAFGFFISSQAKIDERSFDFSPIEINAKKLEASRTKHLTAKYDPQDKRVLDFQKIVRLANADQFRKKMAEEDIEKRGVELIYYANEVLEAGYFPTFWAIGESFFAECRHELPSVVSALQSGKTLDAFSTDDTYLSYRESCGNILPALMENGVISKNGDWIPNGEEVTDILNRYRWGQILAERKPTWKQLSREEYRVFEEWRVKNKKGFSAPRRIKFAETAAKRLPDFPSDLFISKILFQQGNHESALQRLQKAKHKTPMMKKMLRFLENTLPSSAL